MESFAIPPIPIDQQSLVALFVLSPTYHFAISEKATSDSIRFTSCAPLGQRDRSQTPREPLGSMHCTPTSVHVVEGPVEVKPESQPITEQHNRNERSGYIHASVKSFLLSATFR